MKKFDTLYKRTKTGDIQFWEVWVASSMSESIIHKQSGQLGTTKPILHQEVITKGKNLGKANATTHEQQALLQAESDWKKKFDEGYKTLAVLNIAKQNDGSYCWSRELGTEKAGKREVPYYGTLPDVLDQALPEFNTDASGNVKPMLAKAVDWKKVTYPCYVQPKLDGVRCLMVVNREGPDLTVTFLSRTGKEYTTLNHIKGDVLLNAGPEPFILDGEVYSDELTFQQIVAAVKKQRPDSLKLRFRAYDIISDSQQSERRDHFQMVVRDINSPYIEAVPTIEAMTQQYIKQYHDDWVQKGYEGAMIRLFDGKYAQGQRSSHLLKVKEFDETEFAFLRFEYGQRGVEDIIAVCIVEDGREFRAKMQGNKTYKEQLYRDMDRLEGTSLTVKHFGLTDDGLPRFPVGKAFRNYE